MAPIDWALIVLTGIGGAFGLCCLFDGARRIMLYRSNAASAYLIAVGAAICLLLAGYAYWRYREQGGAQADFLEFVMWLVSGASALVFGALFAREPAAAPAEEVTVTKIEPVLAPAVAAPAPQPAAAAVAPAKPAAPAAAPPPAAPPKPAVGADTVPLPKPAVGSDTVPLAKPRVGEDTVPLPKPRVGEDTVPLPRPGIAPATKKSSVGEDTVPLAKPAPGSLTPPPKKS
jgi:hypothetical protein